MFCCSLSGKDGMNRTRGIFYCFLSDKGWDEQDKGLCSVVHCLVRMG
jgi:hypothetical protein